MRPRAPCIGRSCESGRHVPRHGGLASPHFTAPRHSTHTPTSLTPHLPLQHDSDFRGEPARYWPPNGEEGRHRKVPTRGAGAGEGPGAGAGSEGGRGLGYGRGPAPAGECAHRPAVRRVRGVCRRGLLPESCARACGSFARAPADPAIIYKPHKHTARQLQPAATYELRRKRCGWCWRS